MFDPFDQEEEEASDQPRPPFPTPTGALLLTFGASFASLVVAVGLFEDIDLLALGVGEALGVGGVATIAARWVPDPQAERIGLRGFSPRLVPLLLCLVPLVFLASELDNVGRALDGLLPDFGVEATSGDAGSADAGAADAPGSPPASDDADAAVTPPADADRAAAASTPEPAGDEHDSRARDDTSPLAPVVADAPEGWALVQIAIVTLGISPIVEGFLFFGVILQGLVAWLGRGRGLLLTSCLYALIHAFGQTGGDAGVFQALAAIVSAIGMGVALGICRLSTGSVLAPILVDTSFKAVALVAIAAPAALAIPGYNVGTDAHTPLSVLLPSLGIVAWGFWVLTRQEQTPS